MKWSELSKQGKVAAGSILGCGGLIISSCTALVVVKELQTPAKVSKVQDGKTPEKISGANFTKIQAGMPYQEVVEILGESNDKGLTPQGEEAMRSNGIFMRIWHSGEGQNSYSVFVFFNHGVVTRKEEWRPRQ